MEVHNRFSGAPLIAATSCLAGNEMFAVHTDIAIGPQKNFHKNPDFLTPPILNVIFVS